jgi:hypothetical protein
MKKTNKENPITTFRKNFETRTKTVMSSLKKAKDGMDTKTYQGPLSEAANKLLDNRYPSTAPVKIPYAPQEATLIRGFNPIINGEQISNEARESMDRNMDENKMRKPGYKGYQKNADGTITKTIMKKGGTIKKTIMKKGGPVKKYEPGGSISSDRVGKNRIVSKNKQYGTDNSGNDWVAKRKTVYDNMGTKDNPIVSNQRSRSKITRTDAVTGDQKTTVTKTNSNGKMTTRNALFAVKQKIGGSVKYKTGGATKATKFAALAPPFNKATAADRIAGAKKNASKKK